MGFTYDEQGNPLFIIDTVNTGSGIVVLKKGKKNAANSQYEQVITIEKDRLVLNKCIDRREQYTWNTVQHMIPMSKVVAYLEKNPTLDEKKAPLRFAKCSTGTEYDFRSAIDGPIAAGSISLPDAQLHKAKHIVPFSVLRKFIDENKTLSAVFYKKGVKTVEVVKVETVYVETPLAMTPDEQKEMRWALQRQQHIRNEYLRRAYVSGDETDIAENLVGMNTLKSLMERLEVPMAEWMNNDMALAELPLIEGKEVTT